MGKEQPELTKEETRGAKVEKKSSNKARTKSQEVTFRELEGGRVKIKDARGNILQLRKEDFDKLYERLN